MGAKFQCNYGQALCKISVYLRTKTTLYHDTERDCTMDAFYEHLTPSFASKLVIEYKHSMLPYQIVYMNNDAIDSSDEFSIKLNKEVYTIANCRSDKPSCSCITSLVAGLPCRHIFFLRRSISLEPFVRAMVPSKYTIDFAKDFVYRQTNKRKSIYTVNHLNRVNEDCLTKKPMSKDEKFNLIWRPLQEYADYISSQGESDFIDHLQNFLLVKDYTEKKVLII